MFEEGSPGDCMHLVRAGALEVQRTEGVEHYVLARLVPGHAFGELAVLDRTPRTATVIAVDRERDRVRSAPRTSTACSPSTRTRCGGCSASSRGC